MSFRFLIFNTILDFGFCDSWILFISSYSCSFCHLTSCCELFIFILGRRGRGGGEEDYDSGGGGVGQITLNEYLGRHEDSPCILLHNFL